MWCFSRGGWKPADVGYSRGWSRRRGGCGSWLLWSASMTVCVGGGRTRMSGYKLGAPSPPCQTAELRRALQTSCSASSRGWCGRPTARVSGFLSSPCVGLAGQEQSRRLETGRTWCLLLSAWTRSSRREGCSMPESSRQSLVLMTASSRSRPTGRTRSSRWRHRFACRNLGRTGASSRKTWWLRDRREEVELQESCCSRQGKDVGRVMRSEPSWRRSSMSCDGRVLSLRCASERESEAAGCFPRKNGDYKKAEAC